MIDKKLERVFELRDARDKVNEKLKAIDETKVPLVEQIEQIQLELEQAQNEVLREMDEKNVKTYTYGINNVTAAIRRTLGIVDEKMLSDTIVNGASKIAKKIGMPVREIKAKAFIKTLNKPFVKDIADSFLKVEGTPLPGTEVKETKYLTIK